MQNTLIDQGLNLMLYGMGTVFVFLTILVFATRAMSFMVARLSPNDVEKTQIAQPAQSGTYPSPDVLAAIKQAIAAHRAR